MEYLPRTELQGDDYCLEDLLRLHLCFLWQEISLANQFPVIFTSSLIHQRKLAFLHSSLAFLTTYTVGQLIHLESAIC